MSRNDFLIKHRHVYIFYLLYLKAYREKVKKMPKKNIYVEVSRPFFIDRQACAKIINKMLRNGYTPSKLEVEDFKRNFSDVRLVQEVELN